MKIYFLKIILVVIQIHKSGSEEGTCSSDHYSNCNCPSQIYSDCNSIAISCAMFPSDSQSLSLQSLCLKSKWWKNKLVTVLPDISEGILNSSACKKLCSCYIKVNLAQFHCGSRGGPIIWYDEYTVGTRSYANCNKTTFPFAIISHNNNVVASVRLFGQSDNSQPLKGLLTNVTGFEDQGGIYDKTILPLAKSYLTSNSESLTYLSFGASTTPTPEFLNIMGKLKNLEIITLANFNTTMFPDEADFTSSLKYFRLIKVPLIQIPKWLQSCTFIQVVHFESINSQIDLSDFPHLPSLEYFAFTRIAVKSFSLILSNIFPSLQYLDLSQTLIEEFGPDTFSNLSNIKYIDISGTAILQLPFNSQLPSLARLYFAGTLSTNTPSAYCSNLKSMSRSLDKSYFYNVPNITYLDLSNHEKLELSDDTFSFLKLKTLILTCTRLTTIPPAVTNICTMENFEVNDNQLNGTDSLPLAIAANWKNLQTFAFMFNYFKSVPPLIYFLNLKARRLQIYLRSSFANMRVAMPPCENYKLYKLGILKFVSSSDMKSFNVTDCEASNQQIYTTYGEKIAAMNRNNSICPDHSCTITFQMTPLMVCFLFVICISFTFLAA